MKQSPRKVSNNHSHTSSLSKLERKRLVFDQLSSNFDKIIGSHKKMPSLNLNLIQDIDLKMQKFKRTPSPDKRNPWNSSHSPVKPQEVIPSRRYIDLLRENFGIDDKDTLSLAKINRNGLQKLREKGFVDRHGTVNFKFVTRYVEVLGAKHPLKKAKTCKSFSKATLSPYLTSNH
jgi:hypothetical protein